MNWKALVINMASGFFAAVIIDINAWSKADGPFSWKLAFKRWVAGAMTGLGVNGVGTLFPDTPA